MRLSTRGRYATRLLICIARNQHSGPVPKQEIAEHTHVSSDYVEQILVGLKNAGIVRSFRGAKGGFTLARPAADITVWDILAAVEGPMALAPCLDDLDCADGAVCVTRGLWQEATGMLQRYFNSQSLGDLVERQEELRRDLPVMFEI